MSRSELTMYTWDEIAKHNKEEDCWVVLYDKVLEMTEWMHKHPGGLDPIKDMGGMDITSSFESIGHSSAAQVLSKSYIIGRVDPASVPKRPVATGADSAPKKWSEMNREDLRKYKAGGEIIPLWMIAMIVLVIVAVIYMLL